MVPSSGSMSISHDDCNSNKDDGKSGSGAATHSHIKFLLPLIKYLLRES